MSQVILTTPSYLAMMALPAPPRTQLKITQINLQHSQTATANLRRLLEGKTKTVALIQEPWIRKGRICGLSNIEDWHVSDDVSCSDHRWIKYNLEVTLTSPIPRRNPRKMNRGRYELLTAEKLKGVVLPDNHEGTEDIDNHINQITDCLITSFEQTCPLSSPRARQFCKGHWWGPELEKLRRRVRKLFNRAKNTCLEHHWDAYKQAQYHYKRRIRIRKKECWRRFCTNIETNNQANRVKNILCSEPVHNLGNLKKPDGTYTKTDLETSELLITTHFPGCQIERIVAWEEESKKTPVMVDWITAKEIVTHDKVIWAISNFLPYKSAGLDKVFPGLLRWSDRKLIDHLVSIYRLWS
ncbi:uncharacterized protein LOC123668504 [Melitaea cinxia]|uniref:uncharacterized protein LOC123668504 n=1 Tax=Melitaea cinxia TaxID=113334 RepID=UPI001E272370|nr:uncharacterized protein LOC123668504 [Melitaea cinxia]